MPSGFVGMCTQSGCSTSQVNVCELIIVFLLCSLITIHSLCLHIFFPLVCLTGENPKPALHCTASQLVMPMCHVCVCVCVIAMKFTCFWIEAWPAHASSEPSTSSGMLDKEKMFRWIRWTRSFIFSFHLQCFDAPTRCCQSHGAEGRDCQ